MPRALKVLALNFLIFTARANHSPVDRWNSTPLQDSARSSARAKHVCLGVRIGSLRPWILASLAVHPFMPKYIPSCSNSGLAWNSFESFLGSLSKFDGPFWMRVLGQWNAQIGAKGLSCPRPLFARSRICDFIAAGKHRRPFHPQAPSAALLVLILTLRGFGLQPEACLLDCTKTGPVCEAHMGHGPGPRPSYTSHYIRKQGRVTLLDLPQTQPWDPFPGCVQELFVPEKGIAPLWSNLLFEQWQRATSDFHLEASI